MTGDDESDHVYLQGDPRYAALLSLDLIDPEIGFVSESFKTTLFSKGTMCACSTRPILTESTSGPPLHTTVQAGVHQGIQTRAHTHTHTHARNTHVTRSIARTARHARTQALVGSTTRWTQARTHRDAVTAPSRRRRTGRRGSAERGAGGLASGIGEGEGRS